MGYMASAQPNPGGEKSPPLLCPCGYRHEKQQRKTPPALINPTRNQPEFKEYTKTAASVRDLIVPEEILSYLPERGNDEDFIIGGTMPVTYTGLRWIRKRVEKYTGFFETILPRRFRTTVATVISSETHDLKLVQRMLGHSTPQMTLSLSRDTRQQPHPDRVLSTRRGQAIPSAEDCR
ncbi:MAG: hypothetical protein IKH57_10000 [Clostridia bacterium]|nr:hypothetical protein [Clostridia bacterium]